MLDPQCSAVPQRSLLQDLQGSSSNLKKEKNLCFCAGVYFISDFHLQLQAVLGNKSLDVKIQ